MSDNPEETAYYLRLLSMYMDICTESVRKVFDFHSPNNNGEDFIRLNQAKLNKLKTKGILNQQECKVVITQWPNLRLMDISLLITLCINLFTTVQLTPPTKGWDRPPEGKDITIAADLLRLRKIRNVIVGHHPCARLPQWAFEKEWENIETILLRIEKQIDPGNEIHLQSQIERYLIQQLQPCIQNEHDSKLKEWYQEVSKAQKQVDEYLKNLEGFDVYLKEKSDRYERYIKLLVKGGRFVLSALIKTKCQQSDLRCKLDEKEDILREKITDSEHLEILYPSASDRLATSLDLSVWDISLLSGVLLYAFECSGDLKEAIDNLYNARKNYAEVAVKSLDPDIFVDYLSDLKSSINVAKNYLNSEEKSHINEILEESKKKAKEDGSFKAHMEELKSQGLQMKTFSDIHRETVQKTKETLQQMITHGISFDSNRVLELKMITVGSDEEKKKIAENILFEVWQIALDRTENKGNFQEIQEEVNKVLKEMKKSENIQDISVEQKCILLQIASREPCDMLALIEYFESDLFLKTLDDICTAIGYHCNTIVAICSNVTIESLRGILNEQHLPKQQESGIRVPITVSSPAAMMELWKLFRSEQFSNSINAIAEKLSKHSNTPITLKTFTDMKEFNDVFDGETEQSSTDSESNDSLTQDSSRTLDTELDFPYKGDVAGHPADQSSQYDKQKRLSDIESKFAKLEAIPDDHQKHLNYVKQKKDLQRSLKRHYREDIPRISAYSQQQEGNLSDDFKDVRPRIATESKDEQLHSLKGLKRLKTNDSALKEQSDYEKSKLDLQTRLIEFYREDILRMSVLPPVEGYLYDFKDVYVRPRMTNKSKDNKPKVADVLSMSDIFTKDGKRTKSVYVIGEAGSGKSSFCKSLVNYWCLAHSDEGKGIDDEFNGVKEMKKFDFLFYLPLRHYTDKMRIKEMLESKYEHSALKKLLECESQNCLIVLDGLDEWASPASTCPPERGAVKEYTVLTTSRPWKISKLEISDNEIRQKIILKGFNDETSINNMIKKTVPILNKMFERDKVLSDCQMALKTLKNESMTSLKHTAIMLQQLICLWFDDRLHDGTSSCAMYTEVLDLFFDWHMKKHPDDPLFTEMMKKSEDLKNVELPNYLIGTEICNSYSYIIHDVSRLAYETLFNNTKETSLSFDSSTFERLKISKEVKSCCLKLGILSEDKCLSLSARRIRRSVISFVHKSFQEYLAAVYIAIRYEEHIALSADSGNPDLSDHCAQFIRDFFSKCMTLDEILEQANIFIMLCGLKPRIAVSVSKYIYDIVTRDKRVLKYRRTIDSGHEYLISTIQGCLINCIEEMQACGTCIKSNIYLGDMNFSHYYSDNKCLCESFEMQSFSLDSITSISILPNETDKYLKRVLKYLPKCQRLEAIDIVDMYKIDDEDIKYVCDVIEDNSLTLKALSVAGSGKICKTTKLICRTIVSRLPDMSHLVALKIESVTMPHDDVISLCTFLSSSSHLEQISICYTDCEPSTGSECSTVFHECINQHEVDLSKHQHLQYLEYDDSVTVTRVNTSNLEIGLFKQSSKNTDFMKVLDNLSKAFKLTELSLEYETDGSNKNPSYRTMTDKLITLLPLLYQLRKLTLAMFTFTDNIMKFPYEMKSMKSITLNVVRMSLTTWRQFVDSLHLIPLSVEVRAYNMCITRDGEECNPIIEVGGGGEEASAWQYVRENEALFNVKYESLQSFCFQQRNKYSSV